MKRFLLFAIGLALVITFQNCAESSGSSQAVGPAESVTGEIPEDPNPPFTPPSVDYSLVSCGSHDHCKLLCQIEFPIASEAAIRQVACSGVSAESCNAVIQWHNQNFVPDNMQCGFKSVNQVVDPESLSSPPCSSVSACAQVCKSFFVPRDDEAIKREAAAKGLRYAGSTLKALVENQLIREQLSACLAAPYKTIY